VIALRYARYELLRTFRERQLFIFAFGIPLVLYFVIALPQRHIHNLDGSGLPATQYYMVSLASFGTMMAMMSTGFRIAGERQVGWTRQLRITPLSTRDYFRAKVLTGYTMALSSLFLLYIAGIATGVHMPIGTWVRMTLLIIVALLPFAALGITFGHLLTVDTVGPASGGLVSLFAIVSGTWFPITHGFLHDVGQFIPSYWLVQAGHLGLGGKSWSGLGWAVVLGWFVVLVAVGFYARQRDTNKV
jgi:ABC-2 type transport system permease protein